jgi:hypothetical protein
MAAVNPFATRFTRPGRIVPLDAAGRPVDLAALLARLDELGGRAAIEGAHGSGKSTLLARLHEEAAAHGRLSVLRRLGVGPWRDAAASFVSVIGASPASLVCVDSWERLGRVAGWATRLAARQRGGRLLVTSHGPAGLPVLLRCDPTAEMLAAIVRQLPEATVWLGSIIGDDDIRDAFKRHAPNLREALFHLYDLFEERRSERQTSRS